MQDVLKTDQGPQNLDSYTLPRYLSIIDRFADPIRNGIEDASFTTQDIDLYAQIGDGEAGLQPEINSLVSAGILEEEYDERIEGEKYFWNKPELSDELEKIRDFTASNFNCQLRELRDEWDEDYRGELEDMALDLVFYIS